MIRALKTGSLVLTLALFLAGAAHAATITVTEGGVNRDGAPTANGVVTLREAIVSINSGADINADVTANRVGAYGASDTINFNYLGGGVISLANAQGGLTITKTMAIMGFTELGATVNSAVTGDNSTHTVLISGFNLNAGTDCVTISGQASSGTVVRGVVFDQCSGSGIVITNSKNNVIAGDFFGTDSAGNFAAGAGNATGISISATVGTDDISGNQIGGPNPADRNVISGNSTREIFIGNSGGGTVVSTGIVVQNSYIGMNAAGTTAVGGSGQGIFALNIQSLTIGGASGSLGGSCSGVCNLIAGNGGQGLNVSSSGTYTIQGNFIGTDVTGTLSRPNGTIQAQIEINGASIPTIGGTAAGVGNLISGQGSTGAGILVDSGILGLVTIQGNFIGTTTTGNAVLGNGGPGIDTFGSNVQIGGTTASARNVIGGNGNGLVPKGPGILVEGNSPIASISVIQGNNIGIGADGSTNIGNIGNGIEFSSNANGSTVGASTSGGLGGNIIAFNGAGRTNGAGVGVQNGNNNKILTNSIFSNTGTTTGLGIDLSAGAQTTDGPTANDACDGDAGGNNLQNFPVLTAAGTNGSSITVSGTLNSTASTTFTVEFFANSSGTQGRTFLGSTSTSTNGACNASFSAAMAQVVAPGTNITATATDPSGNTSEFSAAVVAAVTTAADSTVTGHISDSNGNPLEGVAIRLSGAQTRLTITDSNGNYHFDNVETNGVYSLTPSRPNFVFGPTQQSFTVLGQHTAATFNATPTGGTVNPLDTTEYFVRQQYVDFLGREPDEAGFNFWVNNIQSCGADSRCTEVRRIDTSAAFFLSIEFQQTGYLVYRMYQTSYGDLPGMPIPVRLNNFKLDTQQIDNGVIVNQEGWQTALEINKQTFATEFVQRSQFTSAYPTSMSPTELVNKLLTNAGINPSDTDRAAMINEFGGAANTVDISARARALRRVSENSLLVQREFDQAFVLIEYFGYLRRDPNSAPDTNFDGYNFWLTKLDSAQGNYQNAEMVRAFLVATEYRQRFPR